MSEFVFAMFIILSFALLLLMAGVAKLARKIIKKCRSKHNVKR